MSQRRWRLGCAALATALGLSPRGYFIPCCSAASAGDTPAGYPALAGVFGAAEPRMLGTLAAIEAAVPALLAIDGAGAPPPAPRLRQDWFPRLDAAAAWVLVREHSPARLIEIGCGHSTRWFARAVADAGAATRLTAIDPAPRAILDGLGIELIRAPVQQVRQDVFAGLTPGDVLSLDGSHVLMPGSDADVVLNQVLPALPPGVRVHLHDIFLPDPYPADWAWRGYNEQLAVATLLQGGNWQILWSSHWVATRLAARLQAGPAARLPLLPGAHESSLWLEKR